MSPLHSPSWRSRTRIYSGLRIGGIPPRQHYLIRRAPCSNSLVFCVQSVFMNLYAVAAVRDRKAREKVHNVGDSGVESCSHGRDTDGAKNRHVALGVIDLPGREGKHLAQEEAESHYVGARRIADRAHREVDVQPERNRRMRRGVELNSASI